MVVKLESIQQATKLEALKLGCNEQQRRRTRAGSTPVARKRITPPVLRYRRSFGATLPKGNCVDNDTEDAMNDPSLEKPLQPQRIHSAANNDPFSGGGNAGETTPAVDLLQPATIHSRV